MTVPGEAQVPAGGVESPRSLAATRAFDAWDAHVAVLDADGHILAVNAAWDRFARHNGGWGVGEGADYFAVCAAASADEPLAATALAGLRGVLDGSATDLELEYPCSSSTEERWFRLRARRLDPPVGGRQLLVVHDNVTDRRRIQDDIRARSLLLDEVDAAVVATDLRGVVTLWNPGAERLYGWSAEEAVGRSVAQLIVAAGDVAGADEFLERHLTDGAWEGGFTARRPDGIDVPVHARDTLVHDASGAVTGWIGISVDQSDRVAHERELSRSARWLRAVTDSIGDGLCTLDRHGRITYVNPQGSRLVRQQVIGSSFLQLLHGRANPEVWSDATSAAARHGTGRLVGSDGVALPIDYVATPLVSDPDDPGDPDGVGWVVVFRDVSERIAREDQLAEQVEQVVWLGRIRDALEHDGFRLHAQPIVDLRTGQTVQHELLIRMRDPDDGERLIAPGRFLPTAEALGVAPAIDRWVLERGLDLAAAGHAVELNLSATSLEDPTLPRLIEALLQDTGADPSKVVFEVTETALLRSHATARSFADHVRRLGCGLALDDFGTGFGGFTYLKSFPLDFLKIDLEFVRDAVTNPASRHVVAAIVSLASSFGLETVAEGVEDEATLELMRDHGVDFAQGYLLGRPAAADEVLANHHRPER